MDRYQLIIAREQARGSVPKQLSDEAFRQLVELEESIHQLEAACTAIDEQTLDVMLSQRYNYPDMFMEDIIADHIRNDIFSRYPAGWADESQDKFFINDHPVDENSTFSLWAPGIITITIRELKHYPLLGFNSVGAYATFMFLLYGKRFEDATRCLSKSGEHEPRQLFDELFAQAISEPDFLLLQFLLYQGLWSKFGPRNNGAELKYTRGDKLLSIIPFPKGLMPYAEQNFYGELLMKFRRAL